LRAPYRQLLSWKPRSLDQQSEQFPSPFFPTSTGRQRQPGADYTELAAAPPDAAWLSAGAHAALDETEWGLSELTPGGGAAGGSAAAAVAALYPHLQEGRRAEEARASDAFTKYDGWIRSGAPELDPRGAGDPQSASRLQLLAACPFRYFVRYVLGVQAPDSTERDRMQWSTLMAGSPRGVPALLRGDLRARREARRSRHAELIVEIADAQIGVWREKVPPRSELVRGAAGGAAVRLRAFLRLEEEHAGSHASILRGPVRIAPADLRAAIASREPVAIDAAAAVVPAARSIDRVDEGADGAFWCGTTRPAERSD
jgi:ATP-dependent helicase/nuclease subunit B